MTIPVEITYLGLPPSPALSDHITRHANRLQHFAPRLQACHVTVSRSEHHHHSGNRFSVTAHASLPGGDFHAGRTCEADRAHEDAYVAASEAIDALRRQLEEFQTIRRERAQSDGRPHGDAA